MVTLYEQYVSVTWHTHCSVKTTLNEDGKNKNKTNISSLLPASLHQDMTDIKIDRNGKVRQNEHRTGPMYIK